jgi:hypothetical protein
MSSYGYGYGDSGGGGGGGGQPAINPLNPFGLTASAGRAGGGGGGGGGSRPSSSSRADPRADPLVNADALLARYSGKNLGGGGGGSRRGPIHQSSCQLDLYFVPLLNTTFQRVTSTWIHWKILKLS